MIEFKLPWIQSDYDYSCLVSLGCSEIQQLSFLLHVSALEEPIGRFRIGVGGMEGVISADQSATNYQYYISL